MTFYCCKTGVKALLVALCIGAAFLPSYAYAESMSEALEKALETHPSVLSAQEGVATAKADERSALSGYFPEVSVSTALGRVYQDNATSRGLVTDRGAAYSGYGEGNIALRQTIFDGMATQGRIDAARARSDAKQLTVLDTQETLALRVASSYVEVLRIRDALKLLEQQKTAIADYESRINDMAKNGAADESEVQQARDVSMIVEGVIADYKGQLVSAQAIYAELVGQAPSDHLESPPDVEGDLSSDVEQSTVLAVENHPALKGMSLEELAAQEDVNIAKAQYLPTIGGELSYAKVDKKDLIGGESEDQRALVRMNWNFSTGGKQIAEVDKRRHQALETKRRREDLQRQIERDVLVTHAKLQMFRDKVKISEDRVALNEKLLSAYEAQFEGAKINLLGLMRAQSQLFNAKLEKSDNQYNLIGAQYGVLAAMGELRNVLSGKGSAAQSVSADEEPDLSAGGSGSQ